MLLLEFLYISFILRHIPADVSPMIVLIGERRINFREAQLWVCGHDFVRGLPLLLMQNNDILDSDAMAGNAWFPPADAGGLHNVAIRIRVHTKTPAYRISCMLLVA